MTETIDTVTFTVARYNVATSQPACAVLLFGTAFLSSFTTPSFVFCTSLSTCLTSQFFYAVTSRAMFETSSVYCHFSGYR